MNTQPSSGKRTDSGHSPKKQKNGRLLSLPMTPLFLASFVMRSMRITSITKSVFWNGKANMPVMSVMACHGAFKL